jgi:hypothetical protein
MLVENIWVERGLVNDALGTVCNIMWNAGDDCRCFHLFALLVQLGQFNSPTFEETGLVPVFRSRREFHITSAITPSFL